ncbi:MAG: hypothetical protein LBB09_01070 [Rickettsiales bacterium]|jgi:protein-export membrane protein SecD|nr:hypothetical protein [Rickettsiales bacterium]
MPISILKRYFTIFCAAFIAIMFLNGFSKTNFWPGKKTDFGICFTGGDRLLLKPDYDSYWKNRLADAAGSLSADFQSRGIRALAKVSAERGEINIARRRGEDAKKIKRIVKKIDRALKFQEEADNRILLKYALERQNKINEEVLRLTVSILRKRIIGEKLADFMINADKDYVRVDVPAGKRESVKPLLLRQGKLRFYFLAESGGADVIEVEEKTTGATIFLGKKIIMDGKSVEKAEIMEMDDRQTLFFKLNGAGAKNFADITKNNSGKILAATLDNELITASRISGEIVGGEGYMGGMFSKIEGKKINSLLKNKPLPAELSALEEKSIVPAADVGLVELGIFATFFALLTTVPCFILLKKKKMAVYGALAAAHFVGMISAYNIIGIALNFANMLGIALNLCLFVFFLILLDGEYRKNDSMKNKKHVFKNALVGFRKKFSGANFFVAVVFFALYNLGGRNIGDISLTFLVGIGINIFVFGYCLEYFLEEKNI